MGLQGAALREVKLRWKSHMQELSSRMLRCEIPGPCEPTLQTFVVGIFAFCMRGTVTFTPSGFQSARSSVFAPNDPTVRHTSLGGLAMAFTAASSAVSVPRYPVSPMELCALGAIQIARCVDEAVRFYTTPVSHRLSCIRSVTNIASRGIFDGAKCLTGFTGRDFRLRVFCQPFVPVGPP